LGTGMHYKWCPYCGEFLVKPSSRGKARRKVSRVTLKKKRVSKKPSKKIKKVKKRSVLEKLKSLLRV